MAISRGTWKMETRHILEIYAALPKEEQDEWYNQFKERGAFYVVAAQSIEAFREKEKTREGTRNLKIIEFAAGSGVPCDQIGGTSGEDVQWGV